MPKKSENTEQPVEEKKKKAAKADKSGKEKKADKAKSDKADKGKKAKKAEAAEAVLSPEANSASAEQPSRAQAADSLEPVDAEHPELTPEQVQAIVSGANRTHAEGLGDAWAVVLGRNPAALMPQVVSTVLHEGGTRPAWQWKRGGKEYVLMAWPREESLRASVLMRADEEGGQLRPCDAVPLLEGQPNDLTVESVHPWESGSGADVAVSMIEGKNPMWFYDPLYIRDKDDLTPGITHTFTLAGLCFAVRKALLDDVTITQGPQYEAYAADWLAAHPDKGRMDVPPLKVSMKGRRMIMPGRRFCEYQIRAEVEEVRQGTLEQMPITLMYLRFPFDEREAMLLPVYASKMVLKDYEPKAGDEIDAYIWLQGRVIDFDPQGPDAAEDEVQDVPRQ